MAGGGERPLSAAEVDLAAVVDTLKGGRANDAWLSSWLPGSWQDPPRFREALLSQLGKRRGAVFKSRERDGHDLYHDCVAAHLGRRRVALVGREGLSFEQVSYEALHLRCNGLSSSWVEAGVEAGKSIALVLGAGIDLTVAALSAYRLGLVVSVIPPLGPAYVREALARLEPDLVATAGKLRSLLGPSAEGSLPVTAPPRPAGPVGSTTYPPGEVAARLLCPFGGTEDGIVEVSAQALLDGATRDALLVHTLSPSDVLATPGFDVVQHEPTTTLTTLVAGAARAFIDMNDLGAEGLSLLSSLGVTVLGLHRQLRDMLLERGKGLPGSVRAWFRSLTDVIDGERWDTFHREVPDRKQHGYGVVVGAAAGGAGLFSPPSSEAPGLRVFPAPGISHMLTELMAGEVPALNDGGTFTLVDGEEVVPGFARVVLGRFGKAYAYAGVIDQGPDGRLYPCDEVERVVARVAEVRHAVAFVAPGRHLNEAKVVLLVFVEGRPRPARPALEIHQVTAQISREMGPSFVPDRVEIMPLRPRIVEGKVDRAWCRSQYLTGALSRKARTEAFVLIGRLGYMFAPFSTDK